MAQPVYGERPRAATNPGPIINNPDEDPFAERTYTGDREKERQDEMQRQWYLGDAVRFQRRPQRSSRHKFLYDDMALDRIRTQAELKPIHTGGRGGDKEMFFQHANSEFWSRRQRHPSLWETGAPDWSGDKTVFGTNAHGLDPSVLKLDQRFIQVGYEEDMDQATLRRALDAIPSDETDFNRMLEEMGKSIRQTTEYSENLPAPEVEQYTVDRLRVGFEKSDADDRLFSEIQRQAQATEEAMKSVQMKQWEAITPRRTPDYSYADEIEQLYALRGEQTKRLTGIDDATEDKREIQSVWAPRTTSVLK